MALTPDVPVVVDDEIIDTAWGNAVRSNLMRLEGLIEGQPGLVHFRHVPAGIVDGGGAAWVDWVTIGNIAIPDWARSAIVTTFMSGVQGTAAGLIFFAKTRLGTATPDGASGFGGRFDLPTAAVMTHSAWVEVIPAPITYGTTQTLAIQASRAAGASGTIRANSGTIITGTVRFRS